MTVGFPAVAAGTRELSQELRVLTLAGGIAATAAVLALLWTGGRIRCGLLHRHRTGQRPAGELAASDPLSVSSLEVPATIGGVEAEVLFAGLTPGFVGLAQANATLPATLPSGSPLEYVLHVGPASSKPVTLHVE